MKNVFSVLLIGVAFFKLTVSILNPNEIVTLFGAEVNIWIYRAIWLFAGLLSVYSINKERNKTSKK